MLILRLVGGDSARVVPQGAQAGAEGGLVRLTGRETGTGFDKTGAGGGVAVWL